MCRTRRRLLQKWKAHSRRLMFVCLVGDVVSTNSTNKPKTYKMLKNTIRKRGTIISPTSATSQIILTMKSKNHNHAMFLVYFSVYRKLHHLLCECYFIASSTTSPLLKIFSCVKENLLVMVQRMLIGHKI